MPPVRLKQVVLAVLAFGVLAAPASAATINAPASTRVTSATVTPDLACQATVFGVSQPEFFGGAVGSCGTYVLVDRFSTTATSYGPQASSYDELDQVDVSAGGGTFTLTFGPDTTAPIAFDADPAAVQAALEALPGIGAGNVIVGGAISLLVVEFTGALGGANVGPLTIDGSALTGPPTPSAAVTNKRPGVAGSSLTPVSQGAVTGDGSSGNPFTLDTQTTAGPIGVHHVVTYVNNDSFYTTTVTLTNNDTSSHDVQLSQYADCYLQSSDSGFGSIVGGSNAACTAVANSTALGSEAFIPVTPTSGVSYEQWDFATVLQDMNVGRLSNACQPGDQSVTPDCTVDQDNGMALAFQNTTLTGGGSATFIFKTNFDSALTIVNPVNGSNITDTMPALHGTIANGSGADTNSVIASLTNSQDVSVPLQTLNVDSVAGTWSTAPASPLPPDTYTLTVSESDTPFTTINSVHSTFTVGSVGGGGGGGGGGDTGGGSTSTTATPATTTSTAPGGTPLAASQEPPQQVPPPKAQQTGNALPESGTVLVLLPGTTRYVPIAGVTSLPVGTLIDARKGVVLLTVASDLLGHLQTGEFRGGLFRFTQRLVKKKLITDIKLAGGKFSSICGSGATKKAKARAASFGEPSWADAARRRIVRYLNSKAHGNFNVIGRNASGVERGTEWKTIDTCNSTEVHVLDGTVLVTDLVLDKTVTVKKGKTYVARDRETPRKRKRRR